MTQGGPVGRSSWNTGERLSQEPGQTDKRKAGHKAAFGKY